MCGYTQVLWLPIFAVRGLVSCLESSSSFQYFSLGTVIFGLSVAYFAFTVKLSNRSKAQNRLFSNNSWNCAAVIRVSVKRCHQSISFFLEKMDSLTNTANKGLAMDKKRSLEEGGDNPQHLSNKHARKDAGHLKIQEHASSLLPGSQDAGESTVMSAPVLQAFKEIAREFSLEHNYKIWVNYCVKNDLKTAAVLTDFLTYPEFRQDVEASPFTFGTRIKLKQLLASNKVNATPIQVASNSLIPRKYWKLLFMMSLSDRLCLIGCPWQMVSRRICLRIIQRFVIIWKRDSKK
jgi:hypothetical protein